MTIYLLHIPVGQSVAANILFVLSVEFWQNNCMIRPGTSLTWAFVSLWPSFTRPCLPSRNMTFGAQIVWPLRRLDCLAHTDKTDKTVSQITAPCSIIRLLWTECSLHCACLSSAEDKQWAHSAATGLLLIYHWTLSVCHSGWGEALPRRQQAIWVRMRGGCYPSC